MKNLVARPLAELAAASRRRMGGPVVAPHTSWHLGISSWRATLRRCPSRTGMSSRRRTNRVVVMQTEVRAHEARYRPMLSRGCPDTGSSYPWPWRAGPLAPIPLPALYGAVLAQRRCGGGDAAHASF